MTALPGLAQDAL